jgi:hypothetical protein
MKKYVLQLSACAMAVALVACGGGGGNSTETETQPVITTQPVSVTAGAGSDASFSVVATGGNLKYTWRKDGVVLPDITAQKFTFSPLVAARAGVYDVIVSNKVGSVTSTTATLVVGILPAITTQPVAQSVAAGGSVTFTVVATGSDTLGYQWRKAGTNITGANSASYTLSNVTSADASTYDVVITNTYGTASSAVVALTLK